MNNTLLKSILPNGAAPAGAVYGKVANVGNFSSTYIAGSGGGGAGYGNYVHSNSGAGSISNGSSYDTAITIDNAGVSITKPLVVNGRDVMQELDELRDAVLLLTRHVDMEAKYPKLKELKDAYQAQFEKYKTFDALKESK
jgi:hypothetical protein